MAYLVITSISQVVFWEKKTMITPESETDINKTRDQITREYQFWYQFLLFDKCDLNQDSALSKNQLWRRKGNSYVYVERTAQVCN